MNHPTPNVPKSEYGDMIEELKNIRDSIIKSVDRRIARLIYELENPGSAEETPVKSEWDIPFSATPSVFVGKKPAAVLFGNERVDAKSWREVYAVILTRCNENPKHHETLMYLRDKVAGKCRTFLSGSPDGMSKPLKIDEGLYGEIQYGSETLMHILKNHILVPVGFDFSSISIILKW